MCTPMFAGHPVAGFTTFEDLMASVALGDEYMAEDDEADLVCAGMVDTSHAGTCAQPKQPSSAAHSSGESAGPETSVVKRHTWEGSVENREADADKMAKLRQRNRDAQARHRKRQRERAADLASKKDKLQKQLAAARNKRQELQEIKASRGERLCVALAKLSATKDIVRTLPIPQTKFTPTQTVVRAPSRAHQFSQVAPAVPRALGTFLHFMPLAVEQILQPAAPGTPAGGARVITEQYKLQEASRVGCSPSDVCWFLQMHFEVSPGTRLSFSSTLSSTACLASLALNHLATGMQTALFEAMDKSAEECMLEPQSILSEPISIACIQKRSRECFTSAECRRAPSQASMAAAAATCNDSPSAAAVRHPALALSCGVNRRCPIEAGVRNVMRNIVAMFCGVLTEEEIATVCTTMLQQGAVWSNVFQQPADGGEEDAEDDEEMTSYFEGVVNSVTAVLVAFREALEQILNHLPAMVMAAQSAFRQDFADEQPCVVALDAQMRHCALTMAMIDSRLFSEAGAIMCRIAMLSHAHMLSFCQMESLTASTYKQLQPSGAQKERLWEFWSAWESRKQALDETMQASRTAMRALPSTVSLSPQFMDLISDLADGAPRRMAGGGAAPFSLASGPLVGMAAHDMSAALRCLRDVQVVHAADIEAFKDFKEAQIGVLAALSPRQMGSVWSANIKHRAATPDFFGICQLAALQMQRESLFALSTYG